VLARYCGAAAAAAEGDVERAQDATAAAVLDSQLAEDANSGKERGAVVHRAPAAGCIRTLKLACDTHHGQDLLDLVHHRDHLVGALAGTVGHTVNIRPDRSWELPTEGLGEAARSCTP